jgi:hypothetical protein
LAGVAIYVHIEVMENSILLTRRKALGLAAAGLVAPSLISSAFAATSPVLVELFTSQGCSSCPAADQLAGLLMTQPNISVVSLNVDYWDYLGWKDTLAKPEYTKRQMDYAHARGDMDVYTPQMVINGAAHAVGSNQTAVEDAIANARRHAPVAALTARATDKDIMIDGIPKVSGEATLWLMSVSPKVDVKIERGENAGKSITYSNVARQLIKLGSLKSTDTQFGVQRSEVLAGDLRDAIVLLQSGDVGPVLGLGKLS